MSQPIEQVIPCRRLPAGALVQSAKLRLYVTNDSTSGGTFNTITNTTWAETIT